MSQLFSLLLNNADENYKAFSQKLIPDTNYEILGVRAPILKNIAKTAVKSGIAESFLKGKHRYYEEFSLHGLILGYIDKNINDKLCLVDEFLPYIDNWAICDGTVSGLKCFKKYPELIFEKAIGWIKSENFYTVRFGIVTLLDYFLDANFNVNVLEVCSKVRSEHYYVNMALAWFFSIALIKRFDYTLPFLTERKLNKFVHNKTIQKATESFRICKEKKEFLKTLRI